MTSTYTLLLLSAFVTSTVALGFFVWAVSRRLVQMNPNGAAVIFAPGEVGRTEEPAVRPRGADALQQATHPGRLIMPAQPAFDRARLAERVRIDQSGKRTVVLAICSAIAWLVVGSLLGMLASIKMHEPDWLAQAGWLTFGRVRAAHLNLVTYGWSSLAGIGIALWLLPRLTRTSLVGGGYAMLGVLAWNAGVGAGVIAILSGNGQALEWLEFPWQVNMVLVVAGALISVPLFLTVRARKVEHLYVSVWFLAAALVWFPIIYFVANVPNVHFGVEQAAMNWWYGHNTLGLWVTPLALAAAYYFVPKVLGVPIKSYALSVLGFWSLAMFYSQAGIHHLIGGPLPGWLVTLSIVQSVMMVIPVLAFGVNMTLTVTDRLRAFLHSPTLQFMAIGSASYVLVSFQGSIEALRAFNTQVHFTHYTVGHAHFGLYAFFSFVMFGGIYFVLPRTLNRDWPKPRLIAWHFWLATIGIAVYVIALTIGGWRQGEAMLDAKRGFMESVALTLPYLVARSVGGGLMLAAHLVFAWHVLIMLVSCLSATTLRSETTTLSQVRST